MEDLKELVAEANEEALLADGFDNALIGYVERAGGPAVALYDKEECIQILMKDMSEEEAEEYFYYNVVGAYVGENTPMFATINK
jgi:hypothetical protein|tara:strand:- start:130 stop:381 length:252 start_codon:yes stop_codon:yes gene_type:complete